MTRLLCALLLLAACSSKLDRVTDRHWRICDTACAEVVRVERDGKKLECFCKRGGVITTSTAARVRPPKPAELDEPCPTLTDELLEYDPAIQRH